MADRPTAIEDALRETLRDHVTLHGVSGFEQPLVQYFRQRVEAASIHLSRDGIPTISIGVPRR